MRVGVADTTFSRVNMGAVATTTPRAIQRAQRAGERAANASPPIPPMPPT